MMKKVIAMLLCGVLAGNTYTNLTKVVEIDRQEDTVLVEDFNGNLWEFEGSEDWQEGDWCNLLMYDNNTADITDDVIVRATYERIW